MNKTAVYIRVSTQNQKIDMQQRDLNLYCEQRNFNIYETYIDHGVSGSKDSRPALDKLMKDARKRRFNTVLVWRFDRWARSMKMLLGSLEEFQQLNIAFISFSENIDTNSNMGKVIFSIMGALSEFEKSLLIERINGGLAAARARGKTLGRPKKRNDQLIKALRKQGLSFRAIAKKLNTSLGSVQQALK